MNETKGKLRQNIIVRTEGKFGQRKVYDNVLHGYKSWATNWTLSFLIGKQKEMADSLPKVGERGGAPCWGILFPK